LWCQVELAGACHADTLLAAADQRRPGAELAAGRIHLQRHIVPLSGQGSCKRRQLPRPCRSGLAARSATSSCSLGGMPHQAPCRTRSALLPVGGTFARRAGAGNLKVLAAISSDACERARKDTSIGNLVMITECCKVLVTEFRHPYVPKLHSTRSCERSALERKGLQTQSGPLSGQATTEPAVPPCSLRSMAGTVQARRAPKLREAPRGE
jgi:hypothetical protein